MLLVHASPTTLGRHRRPNLGVLSSPRRLYTNVAGWQWAADNDAYSDWDAERYARMLDTIRQIPVPPLWVTAPDVVGDWEQTYDRFVLWAPWLRGLPAAYVAQDGQPPDRVPWHRIAALFVGGTDLFKMGDDAAGLVDEAKSRGLWVHMGRVNGNQRLRYAAALGCDSVDGTSFSWFRDRWLDEFLQRAAAPTQLMLGADGV